MGIFDNLKAAVTYQTEQVQPAATTITPTAKKVLIVEDEIALANALKLKFRHEGFEALTAENGQIGLEQAISQKPDIILLDLMMPVMDGKVMLKKLREIGEFKSTPVIILTNAGDVDNIRETQLYYNASAFLIKSNVNPDDIVKKVRDLI